MWDLSRVERNGCRFDGGTENGAGGELGTVGLGTDGILDFGGLLAAPFAMMLEILVDVKPARLLYT